MRAPLLLLAACASTPAPADPAVVARRQACAEEEPVDEMARISCESDRARLARRSEPPVPVRRRPALTCTTIGTGWVAQTTCQ